MKQLIRKAWTLVLLVAISATFAQGSSGSVVRSHQDVFDCSVYHGNSFAIAGAAYNKVDRTIVSTWWINWSLLSNQRKSKSFSGRNVTVKIRQRTPYNTWFTAASNTCSP